MRDLAAPDHIAEARRTIAAIGQYSDAQVIDACRTLMAHDPATYSGLRGLIAFLGASRGPAPARQAAASPRPRGARPRCGA
ncbi:hypothetical protein C5F48_02295 [Cereibacter changlensis JA139]|jgi:hypothetical protein|uniref:Uncharacterized protein n=2 Tax=Cereibacter changlensis TaxID=402884 RepID=A0A2T4JZV8_9RHOB|nr:hypothetical protein [Cereibacter changlensis]MBZ4690436.1 hypothetical protein [Cereibacter sp.]PTE23438.1 hypothetical protein C5F48_02295 [Cereibacter changlensis JA139]PZX49708.1 hypothetical protein LX76_03707 [Cereibacter changlensis]